MLWQNGECNAQYNKCQQCSRLALHNISSQFDGIGSKCRDNAQSALQSLSERFTTRAICQQDPSVLVVKPERSAVKSYKLDAPK